MNDSVSEARNCALRLIRFRDRSEKELSDRLRVKGFSDRVVAETLAALKTAGLVDDKGLARFLDDIGRNVRLLGNRGVRHFLRARGIREELIPDDTGRAEFDRALLVLEKKRKSLEGYAEQAGRRKLSGYLARRGYSQETIRRVLDHAFPPAHRR